MIYYIYIYFFKEIFHFKIIRSSKKKKNKIKKKKS
jgi:hypothetical protein